eukprot:scaffold19419_cov56-Isochrysis_galbana.AAC.1
MKAQPLCQEAATARVTSPPHLYIFTGTATAPSYGGRVCGEKKTGLHKWPSVRGKENWTSQVALCAGKRKLDFTGGPLCGEKKTGLHGWPSLCGKENRTLHGGVAAAPHPSTAPPPPPAPPKRLGAVPHLCAMVICKHIRAVLASHVDEGQPAARVPVNVLGHVVDLRV